MTYFPDLTTYAYSQPEPDLLNIGWLSGEHAFPTQAPSPAFVQALRRCCLQPGESCAGFHVCDLDCAASVANGGRMLTCDHDGREVSLGNGELRVTGSDGRRYAAPTLVAHYVADHHYAPPAAFVDGVMERARQLVLLSGEPLERVRKLTTLERYELCLDALHALARQPSRAWLTDVLRVLDEARPGSLDRFPMIRQWRERKRFRRLLDAELAAPSTDMALVGVVKHLVQFFSHRERGPEFEDRITLHFTTEILEQTHEAGLRGWRPELSPRRGDEGG